MGSRLMVMDLLFHLINEALINFDEELEKAMRRITNWNKKVRTNLCDVGDDVFFFTN